MRVEFEFDRNKVEALGYHMEQVEACLKSVFFADSFRCTAEGHVMIFEDNDQKDDFANMWANIMDLINSSWFLKCATACRWYDLSDNGEEELFEDVLAQAHHLIRKKA